MKRDLYGMRILVTEDNALYADILRELLMMRRASVNCVYSGEEAVRIIAEDGEPYDAVLMDVQMPGMNGFEATKGIRALAHGAKLPVFAMTASSQECDRRQAFSAGMNDFLQKPIEMAMLDRALTLALA